MRWAHASPFLINGRIASSVYKWEMRFEYANPYDAKIVMYDLGGIYPDLLPLFRVYCTYQSLYMCVQRPYYITYTMYKYRDVHCICGQQQQQHHIRQMPLINAGRDLICLIMGLRPGPHRQDHNSADVVQHYTYGCRQLKGNLCMFTIDSWTRPYSGQSHTRIGLKHNVTLVLLIQFQFIISISW